MKQWKALISEVVKSLVGIDPKVKAEYQRPLGDDSGTVDIFLDKEVDIEDAIRALRNVCKAWGCVTDSDTNSKDASFRLNIEGDFTQKQIRKKM